MLPNRQATATKTLRSRSATLLPMTVRQTVYNGAWEYHPREGMMSVTVYLPYGEYNVSLSHTLIVCSVLSDRIKFINILWKSVCSLSTFETVKWCAGKVKRKRTTSVPLECFAILLHEQEYSICFHLSKSLSHLPHRFPVFRFLFFLSWFFLAEVIN